MAAVFLGDKVTRVSIVPDEKEGTLGHVERRKPPKWFRPDLEMTPRIQHLIEKRIISLYAGQLAERRFGGRHNWVGGRSDTEAALELALWVNGPDPILATAYLRWLQLCAEGMLDKPGFWPAVVALADALLDAREFSGHRATEVIRAAVDAALGLPPLTIPGVSRRA